MTTIAFTPSTSQVFRFQATLDGAIYTVSVPWNVYRQDWYVNVRNQSDALVLSTPLVGSPSPPQNGVNLTGGYFTSTALYYYASSGIFVVAPPLVSNPNYVVPRPVAAKSNLIPGAFLLDISLLGGGDVLAP